MPNDILKRDYPLSETKMSAEDKRKTSASAKSALKERISGPYGTYAASKSGNVKLDIPGKSISLDTLGYSKGKKDYDINISDRDKSTNKKNKISREDVVPTIESMKSFVGKKKK
jgi:hypothetical protein